MTKVIYKAEIFAEGDCFVGYCRELDVSSFGDTPEEASSSLQEAVEAYLEGCENLGTLDYVMVDSGFEKKKRCMETSRAGCRRKGSNDTRKHKTVEEKETYFGSASRQYVDE